MAGGFLTTAPREVPILLFNIYLFIYFWLCQVLVAAHGIFIVACRIFSCSMQTLSCDMWDLLVAACRIFSYGMRDLVT